jgi:hypothetical protein
MSERNKDSLPRDRWPGRWLRHLREWRARNGRTIHDQMLGGLSYGIGSGAVSLLVIWYETRH